MLHWTKTTLTWCGPRTTCWRQLPKPKTPWSTRLSRNTMASVWCVQPQGSSCWPSALRQLSMYLARTTVAPWTTWCSVKEMICCWKLMRGCHMPASIWSGTNNRTSGQLSWGPATMLPTSMRHLRGRSTRPPWSKDLSPPTTMPTQTPPWSLDLSASSRCLGASKCFQPLWPVGALPRITPAAVKLFLLT